MAVGVCRKGISRSMSWLMWCVDVKLHCVPGVRNVGEVLTVFLFLKKHWARTVCNLSKIAHPVPPLCVISSASLTAERVFHKPQFRCLRWWWRFNPKKHGEHGEHGEHGRGITVGLDYPGLRRVFSLTARNHWWEVHWWMCEGTQQGAVVRQPSCK